VRDALVRQAAARVDLVAEQQPPDAARPQQRQRAEDEDRHGPQADRVVVAAHLLEARLHERELPQHEGEEAVAVGPDARGAGRVRGHVPVGVERREPVAPRLVDVDRLDRHADLAQQPEGEQAVLAAAAQHRVAPAVGGPQQPRAPRPPLERRVGEDEPRAQVALAPHRRQAGDLRQQEGVGLEEFLDQDLARRVTRHVLEELPVVGVERPVQHDLPAEEAVVQRDLRRDHGREVLGQRLVGVEDVLAVAVDEVEARDLPAARHRVGRDELAPRQAHGPDLEAVDDLEHRVGVGRARGGTRRRRRRARGARARACARRCPRRRPLAARLPGSGHAGGQRTPPSSRLTSAAAVMGHRAVLDCAAWITRSPSRWAAHRTRRPRTPEMPP
jgi:hypothetical protein